MDDIEMELWMARQEGLQAMYQERVANPNRVKTMEEDLAEQMVVAQKAMDFSPQQKYSFQPLTMEQDLYRSQSIKSQQAAKYGYDPVSSDKAKILKTVANVLFFIGRIENIILAITVIGIPVAWIQNKIYKYLFNIADNWAKILDIRELLAPADRREVENLFEESNTLTTKMKRYQNYSDMPPALQQEIQAYLKDNYAATNNMKAALHKIATG